MHPQLTLQNNPMCVEYILAFQKCHADHGFWGRMLGTCNEEKRLLDMCFRAQKKVKRKTNLDQARADRERWLAACREHASSQSDVPKPA